MHGLIESSSHSSDAFDPLKHSDIRSPTPAQTRKTPAFVTIPHDREEARRLLGNEFRYRADPHVRGVIDLIKSFGISCKMKTIHRRMQRTVSDIERK